MNLTIAILLFTAIATTTHAQEVKHAPTVEQCQADARLWMSKLEQPHEQGLADVSYSMLADWMHEMNDCESVDPDHSASYLEAGHATGFAMAIRQRNFIMRHQLWNQFLKEDEERMGR